METTLKQRIAIAILLIVGGMGIGVSLRHAKETTVPQQLSPPEQHAVEVLQSIHQDPQRIDSILPWAKRLVAGESIMLLSLGDVFAICPGGTVTLEAPCGDYERVNYRSQLGALLRAGSTLTIVMDPDTNGIYVHDRVGYSILPRGREHAPN